MKFFGDYMKAQTFFAILVLFIFSLSFASAITVSDVSQESLFPGNSVSLDVDLKNNLDEDVTDVSFNLIFDEIPFISIGSSEKSYDQFDDGDKKSVTITIKASQDIKPGDYSIPYTLSYVDSENNLVKKVGSIGVVVRAKTELDFDVELDTNVIGEQGKVSLKIINQGFGDIKFVNVRLIPEGFTIIGSDSNYIGTINSDDFETATFDVVFNKENPKALAIITYKDFDNVQQVENVQKDLKVYTREEGIELGIIQKNNTFVYVISIVILVVIWLTYKFIRKRLKKKKKE